MTSRIPTIFFGHGSPIIALQQNAVTEAWRSLGRELHAIQGIVCVSAHWVTRGTAVTGNDHPQTIHDFGGFPEAMFAMRYPAAGSEALCGRVTELLAPERVPVSNDWGYDHGCWTVLMKAFPDASVPVIQLSLDAAKSPAEHYELGRRLKPLRDEGILVMGSGNIVHNLGDVVRQPNVRPHPYAAQFAAYVRENICSGSYENLLNYSALGNVAKRAVPTPDHYWPLLYVLGASDRNDRVRFENAFIDYGSIDMTTVVFEPSQSGKVD